MYLTRIEIDTHRRDSRQVLSSPHRMHGAVATCFPPSARSTRPLWRIDVTRDATLLYLLSDTRPDPTGFVERHGWPAAQAWMTRDYTPAIEAVDGGRRFGFRVRVNPVRSVRPEPTPGDEGPRPRGQRVGHVTADQQLCWFLRRAEGWGFSAGSTEEPSATIVERKVWRFERGGKPVTVSTAAIEGVLTVTDADRLRSALVDGLGPAKAYGCGLLTLTAPR